MWKRGNSPLFRLLPGHRRNGYGLASLVVVIFFASLVISVITDEMIRDEVRAISEGNFRTAQMQLNSMKNLPSQSGAEATSFHAHMIPATDVSVAADSLGLSYTQGTMASDSYALFETRLRGFLGLEVSEPLPAKITPDLVRRPHPERLLRQGDQMFLDMDMDANSIADVGRTEIITGIAQSNITVEPGGEFLATETSLLEAPELDTVFMSAQFSETQNVEGVALTSPLATIGDAEIGIALIDGNLTTEIARFNTTDVSENFIDRCTFYPLENRPGGCEGTSYTVSSLNFGMLNSDGLRVETTEAGVLDADQIGYEDIPSGEPIIGNGLPEGPYANQNFIPFQENSQDLTQ